jgi:hypothetical protein
MFQNEPRERCPLLRHFPLLLPLSLIHLPKPYFPSLTLSTFPRPQNRQHNKNQRTFTGSVPPTEQTCFFIMGTAVEAWPSVILLTSQACPGPSATVLMGPSAPHADTCRLHSPSLEDSTLPQGPSPGISGLIPSPSPGTDASSVSLVLRALQMLSRSAQQVSGYHTVYFISKETRTRRG